MQAAAVGCKKVAAAVEDTGLAAAAAVAVAAAVGVVTILVEVAAVVVVVVKAVAAALSDGKLHSAARLVAESALAAANAAAAVHGVAVVVVVAAVAAAEGQAAAVEVPGLGEKAPAAGSKKNSDCPQSDVVAPPSEPYHLMKHERVETVALKLEGVEEEQRLHCAALSIQLWLSATLQAVTEPRKSLVYHVAIGHLFGPANMNILNSE